MNDTTDNSDDEMTFLEKLSQALNTYMPAMMEGIGAGLAASDPRTPYKGAGVGMAAGGQAVSRINAQQRAIKTGISAEKRATETNRQNFLFNQKVKNEQFDIETDKMMTRQEKLNRAVRAQEKLNSAIDAQDFKMIRGLSGLHGGNKAALAALSGGAPQTSPSSVQSLMPKAPK